MYSEVVHTTYLHCRQGRFQIRQVFLMFASDLNVKPNKCVEVGDVFNLLLSFECDVLFCVLTIKVITSDFSAVCCLISQCANLNPKFRFHRQKVGLNSIFQFQTQLILLFTLDQKPENIQFCNWNALFGTCFDAKITLRTQVQIEIERAAEVNSCVFCSVLDFHT